MESIADPRIRVVDATWDESRGHFAYADVTNAAMESCTGDWCLYVQADEVLHEEDHEIVRSRCAELLGDARVEGLLFDYLHFFGDYEHVQRGQGWYQREIRVVRNGVGIRSVRDAQSFRRHPQRRITVAPARARIFHYGWVRHPRRMQAKLEAVWTHRLGTERARSLHGGTWGFDYGPLARLPRWEGDHPRVMQERIERMDWSEELREVDPPGLTRRVRHRDERLLYRMLTSASRLTGIDFNHTNHGRILDV